MTHEEKTKMLIENSAHDRAGDLLRRAINAASAASDYGMMRAAMDARAATGGRV